MPKRSSLDLRKVVIKLQNEGKVSREIAKRLAIGKSTVNDIINKIKSTVKMPKRSSLDLRKVVIKLQNEGNVSREIAKRLAIGKSTVNDIINKIKSTGTLKDKSCPEIPRKTNNYVDKMIKRKAIADVEKKSIWRNIVSL
ncbi:hypothetical protein QE152_g10436 [Popillia japonica]|uniref:Transposase n=1 Tax=Popillia japonica TaxID=7064 RepID=A0AAW1LRD4_POPJA